MVSAESSLGLVFGELRHYSEHGCPTLIFSDCCLEGSGDVFKVFFGHVSKIEIHVRQTFNAKVTLINGFCPPRFAAEEFTEADNFLVKFFCCKGHFHG